MNALLSRWIETGVGADWAVGFLAKLTLLLVVAWLLHSALVRANPRWRVLVWRGSAASALIVLALTLAGPAISLAVLPPITESSSTSVGMSSPPLTGPRAVNPAVGSDHEPNQELSSPLKIGFFRRRARGKARASDSWARSSRGVSNRSLRATT
jgi:hypothetical protein